MSAVEVKALAAVAETARNGGGFIASGETEALDVSAHALLRLSTRVDVNHGASPQASLALLTGPTAAKCTTVLWSRNMSVGTPPGNSGAWESSVRAVVSPDNFIKLTWSVIGGNAGLSLVLGCSGEGIPDA